MYYDIKEAGIPTYEFHPFKRRLSEYVNWEAFKVPWSFLYSFIIMLQVIAFFIGFTVAAKACGTRGQTKRIEKIVYTLKTIFH